MAEKNGTSEIIYPISVQLETMNFCNAKCVMCPATTTERARSTMSDATFRKILDEVVSWPVKPTMTLHGTGEPLLYKKLGERIKAITRHGIPVDLTTNGSLMTRNRAFEVIDAGTRYVEFSIESLRPEVFRSIRIGLDLDDVVSNLLSFVELRNKLNPALSIGMVMITHDDSVEDRSAYEEFFDRHMAPGDYLTVVPRHNFAQGFESAATAGNAPCTFVTNAIHIQSDGIASLCCVDSERVHAMGDVNKNSILDIFNGQRFTEIDLSPLNSSSFE